MADSGGGRSCLPAAAVDRQCGPEWRFRSYRSAAAALANQAVVAVHGLEMLANLLFDCGQVLRRSQYLL